MRNNETGEFELIIGNRQLLSGFFIVVLLFAVAFAMGYVVGQNSPRSAKVAADSSAPTTAASDSQRPAPVTAAAAQQPQQPAADNPPADTAAPPPADAGQQPATQAAKPETAAAQPPAAAPPAAAAPAAQYPEPPAAPAGSYWQVIAVAQPDVDVFYKTLKDRGFPTYVEAAPKGLMRVLVGPYKDRDAMGKAKDEIEKLGFKPFRK